MEDYSSRDAAQRMDGTSRVSTSNISKPLQDEGKHRFTDTVVFLPACKLQEDMVAAAFPKQSGFLY